MTGSGVARQRARIGRLRGLARMWAAGSVTLVLLGVGVGAAGLAQAAARARPVPGPVAASARPLHADTGGQQCFFTFPACTSADPMVAFVMSSNGDSTGCMFKQDTAWGDGSPDTILKYKGGKPNTAIATFTHTYATPKTYQITYTIQVLVNPHNNCAGGTGGLQFTLPAPPVLACQSSQVTVPGVTVPVPISGKPVSLAYGALALTFTPGTTSAGAKCTMQPAASSQTVGLEVPGVSTPVELGSTDTTATIDLFAASNVAAMIPQCDFSSLEVLTNPSVTPPLADFVHANNCFLTPTYHAKWDVVARWTVPAGITQLAHVQATNSDATIYSTQPLTYYVDLDTLPLPSGFTGDAMSPLINYIYSTLAENLPVLDRIALIQDPPAHLLIVNPVGRRIGLDSKNVTHAFAGTGYLEVGGRSIAWVLEPVLGDYNVTARAKAGTAFSVDLADLQFLGHGSAPLIENFAWAGKVGSTGAITKKFTVHGTALAPVLTPHESKTRVKPHTRIRFTLTGSIIPLGFGSVLWRFGDGTKATGHPTQHRYAKPGRYTPTVTVTDAAGYTVTVKLPLIVVKR